MNRALQLLSESWEKAFAAVLSQCSGASWTASRCPAQQPSPTFLWATFAGSQSLRGELAIGVSPETAAILAQTLLMLPEPPATLGDDEKEALAELLRQICGQACSTLRAEVAAAQLEFVSSQPPLWKPADSTGIAITCAAASGEVLLALSEELLQTLDPPAPTHSESPAVSHTIPDAQSTAAGNNLDLLLDVQLGVRLRFGSRRMLLREILQLNAGAVIELDRHVHEPVDLLVDKKVIARGEVVIVEGNYGLRVTEVASARQRVESFA